MILINDPKAGPWICEEAGGTWIPGRGSTVSLHRDDRILAAVAYEDWNKANIVCHIRIDGRMTPEYLYKIFWYPFVQLGVKRITVPVASSNDHSLRFVQNLGFVKEAVLEGAHPEGDILIFRMLRETCRFLGVDDGLERLRKAA